jgi:hypothetical protein
MLRLPMNVLSAEWRPASASTRATTRTALNGGGYCGDDHIRQREAAPLWLWPTSRAKWYAFMWSEGEAHNSSTVVA